MIKASVSTQDISKLSRKLMRTSAKMKREAAKDLAEAALNIRNEALERAPVDKGILRGTIYFQKKRPNGLLWEVGANAKYAPFMEFGTGRKVNLRELIKAGLPTSYAAQFKGKGIREVNIQPRPFLFPSVNNELPKLKRRIFKTIRKVGKEF